MTSEEKRIKQGILFRPGDPELKALKLKAHNLNIDYNRLYEHQKEEREAILKDLLGSIGEGAFLQGPITFHYGCHTTIGKGTFINFNITVQDDASVTIGEYCDFGPNVTIVTPQHPLLASERKLMLDQNGVPGHLCYAEPVTIGNGCWIGAGALIMPGVTIGDNSVIGAGSVVTKDIPANVVAVGNPCRVLREINDHDREFYFKDRRIDPSILK